MPDTEIFDWLAEQLREITALETLVARGALRKAIKEAGLDCGTVNAHELGVVIKHTLSETLRRQGIEDVADSCERLNDRLLLFDGEQTTEESAHAIFKRLTHS